MVLLKINEFVDAGNIISGSNRDSFLEDALKSVELIVLACSVLNFKEEHTAHFMTMLHKYISDIRSGEHLLIAVQTGLDTLFWNAVGDHRTNSLTAKITKIDVFKALYEFDIQISLRLPVLLILEHARHAAQFGAQGEGNDGHVCWHGVLTHEHIMPQVSGTSRLARPRSNIFFSSIINADAHTSVQKMGKQDKMLACRKWANKIDTHGVSSATTPTLAPCTTST